MASRSATANAAATAADFTGLGRRWSEEASPLLLTGPWGWLAYGAIVGGAGAFGYFAGGAVTETIYEWGFENEKK